MVLDGLLTVIQAYEKIFWYSFIYNIVLNLSKLIIFGILLWFGFKTSSILFSYILGLLISLIIALIVCKKLIPELFRKDNLKNRDKKIIKRDLLRYSLPLMFFGLIESIFFWTDSFMIGYFKDATNVGIYNAAVPIAALVLIASELFMQLFLPLINRQYGENNIGLIKSLSKQIGKWIFIVNLPLVLLIILFPGAFINILFGAEYLVGIFTLKILIIGFLFSSIFAISNRLIVMTGRSKVVMKDIMFTAILNVVLNFLLIPKYGINGAAIATTISLITVSMIFAYQANSYLSILPIRRKLVNAVSAVIIPSVLLYIISQNLAEPSLFKLALIGIFYILLYILFLFSFKALDKEDLLIISQLKKRFLTKRLFN